MPYITPEARQDLQTRAPLHPGELNYEFCMLIREYVAAQRLSYQTINDVIGALEGAKAEFQRCVVAPYEQGKREVNGDVWT